MKPLLTITLLVPLASCQMPLRNAAAEDYWTSCKDAYKFCSQRPFHRDCVIWTDHRRPLMVTRMLKDEPYTIVCPIPEQKCKCEDLPPTYQGSGSSRSSTPAPCVCP